MKVLIVSAFIDPDSVGEPRWCYDLAKGISERVDSIIISQTPLKSGVRIADLFPNSTVHEQPGWQLDWMDRRVKALVKPNYFRFYNFAKKVIGAHRLRDSVTCGHHFGPLGMRYPTPLRNSGIPYVIGPVGGSLQLPPGFTTNATRDPWYYRLRDLDHLRFRHDPFLRSSYANAEVLVGAGDYVRTILSDISLKHFVAHSEGTARTPASGIETILAEKRGRSGAIKLLIASRLIFSKGIHYALKALADAKAELPDWELNILGDGVYRGELERLAADLGIDAHVRFHGHVPRERVNDYYRQADLFLFPTIREPSGVVIFEAMGWGIPIITADYGGPATHVTDDFGIKVPVTSPERFVDGLAKAIIQLGNSPEQRLRMGNEALRMARDHYSMDAMVDYFLRIYSEIQERNDTGR